MSDPTSYSEVSEMPFADVLNRYQVLENRDTMAGSIATLQARGEWRGDRSLDPADYPPLTGAEHLELLALGERLARHFCHPAQVHHAVMAGATWAQIAAAIDGDPDRTHHAYQQWTEGQHRLRQDFPGGTIGLGDDEYAEAIRKTDALREIDGQLGQLRRELEDALGRIRQLEAEHEADVQRENWELREAAEAEAWGGRGPSASYEEWVAEGRDDPDEPTNLELEPEPPGWYDVLDSEESQS